MEKRSVSLLALVGGAGVVLVGVLVLLVKVRSAAPEAELDAAELANARMRGDAPDVPPATTATPAIPSPPPAVPFPGGKWSRGAPPVATADPGTTGELPVPGDEPDPAEEVRARRRAAISLESLGPAGLAGAAAGGAVSPPAEEDRDEATQQANRLYDEGDYEAAQAAAIAGLEKNPTNARLLRIATSASCVLGDADKARAYFDRMASRDKRLIQRRCSRYGIDF